MLHLLRRKFTTRRELVQNKLRCITKGLQVYTVDNGSAQTQDTTWSAMDTRHDADAHQSAELEGLGAHIVIFINKSL